MYNVVKLPGQAAGFLGSAHDPFQVASRPERPRLPPRRARSCPPTSRSTGSSTASRCSAVDGQLAPARRGRPAHDLDVYRAKAVRLLHSEAVRRAFRLAAEDPKLRDRYGRTTHGQSLLLARRLVEAGVRFVTVYDHQTNGQVANWDSPRRRLPPAQGRPAPARRPGLRRLDRRPDRAAACSTRRW